MEVAVKYAEKNVAGLGYELEETQTSAENTENLLKKNNIKWKGLKEKVELRW